METEWQRRERKKQKKEEMLRLSCFCFRRLYVFRA